MSNLLATNESGESIEHWIGQYLRTVPEAWADIDPSSQSELQERAVYALVAAGMIERQLTIRLQIIGHRACR